MGIYRDRCGRVFGRFVTTDCLRWQREVTVSELVNGTVLFVAFELSNNHGRERGRDIFSVSMRWKKKS